MGDLLKMPQAGGMRRATLLRLAMLLSLLVAPLPGLAQSFEGRFSGSDLRVYGAGETTREATLDIDWEAEARLGTLMDEPVVSIRFRHAIIAGTVTVPQLTEEGRVYTTVRYNQLPPRVQAGAKLIDVKLRMTFSDGLMLMDVVADVGATGSPGEWSFNVPGSPEWDALFRSRSMLGYLDEETAREAMKSDLVLTGATIESATLSLYELHDLYMGWYDDRETYRLMGTAYERLLEGLERSYGIDASGVPGGWTDAWFYAERSGPLDTPQEWFERLGALGEVLDKLANLPEELRTGSNHGPYEQAVKDLERLGRAAVDATYNYVPEGIDPATIPQGEMPEFQSIDERLLSAGAQRGVRGYSLVWDGPSDLDLSVVCPGGQVISYTDRNGCGGTLDVDANSNDDNMFERPVENIYWANSAPSGAMRIRVKVYKRRAGGPERQPFLLQIRHGDEVSIVEGEVATSRPWVMED